MRAVVKDGIGVFSPQGFLDGTNAPVFMTLEDIHATEQLNVNMLLVSLKKVIFFNKNGLEVFVKILIKLSSRTYCFSGSFKDACCCGILRLRSQKIYGYHEVL